MKITPARRAQYAKIEIGKKQLGLDEDTYREMLANITGKTSRTACTDKDLDKVIAHLVERGVVFTAKNKPVKKKGPTRKSTFYEIPDGPNAKIKRFICAMWNELGYDMTALDTRAKRQAGVDSFLWCNDMAFLQTLSKDLTTRLKKKKAKAQEG